MLETFTIDTFSGREGQSFRIPVAEGGALVTELIELTALGRPPQPGGRAPFSLVFRGRPDVVLPQRIYRVQHDELGTFELFLVPIGPDGTGMRYEAIFT